MWATGCYEFGLPFDWLDGPITPRQFHHLLQSLLDREERERLNFGLVASLIYNSNKINEAPQKSAADFAALRNRAGRPPQVATDPDHCPECGLHAYYGHTPECKRSQALVQYQIATMRQFAEVFPTGGRAVGETWQVGR